MRFGCVEQCQVCFCFALFFVALNLTCRHVRSQDTKTLLTSAQPPPAICYPTQPSRELSIAKGNLAVFLPSFLLQALTLASSATALLQLLPYVNAHHEAPPSLLHHDATLST